MKRIGKLICLLGILPFFFLPSCKPSEEFPPQREESEELLEREVPETNEELPEEQELPEEKRAAAKYLRVICDRLRVREGAGTNFPAAGRVNKGELLLDLGSEGNWKKTEYCGKPCYVSADYVEEIELPSGGEEIERVIYEGMKLIGTEYVYGAVRFHDGSGTPLKGFSKEAFDCSSFMQYIFYKGADVLLSSTTRTQVLQGEAVKREDLRRGDLIFFTNASRQNNTGIEKVGHVGLYLGGNMLLHTSSDFAKAEPISPSREAFALCARRVL